MVEPNPFRDAIRNSIVTHASGDGRQMLLVFEGGWSLVVSNPYSLTGAPAVESLLGSRLLSFREGPQTELLAFEGGMIAEIDLSDSAFTGPEAILLAGPNNLTIVWN